jgi:hypothetical protein
MRFAAAALAALALTATATAAGSGEPKKKIIPAVQAQARAINIHLSDLPPLGWKAKPSSSESSTPHCSYYNPNQSDLTENGDATAPEFTLASGSFVSSTTGIFASATQGRTAYARVVQPKLPLCLAEIFRKGTGVPTTIVSAARVSVPNLAERTDAFRIVADVKPGSQTIRATIDLVSMNRGKVDVALFFAGIGKPFGHAFELGLARKVAARLP